MQVVRVVVCVLCALILAITLIALGAAIAINSTVLNPEFIASELEDVDIHLMLTDQAKQEIPPALSFLNPIIDDAAVDLEPWIREQVLTVLHAVNAYLRGEQEFRIVISVEEAKSYLITRLNEVLISSPPPGFPQIPEGEVDAFVRVIEQELDAHIPDVLHIEESDLDEQTMAELRNARQLTSYLTTSLRVLPVIAVLMILVIALVLGWRSRPLSRYVGASFVLAGSLCLGVVLVVRSVLPAMMSPEVPSEVATALPDFISGISHPLVVYGAVVLLVGVGLVILSFRLKASEY